MFTTNVKRSAAALAATAGLLAAAAPASHADSWGISQVGTVKAPVTSYSYSWGQGWPTYRSGLKSDSNEVAVEGITTWPTYPSGSRPTATRSQSRASRQVPARSCMRPSPSSPTRARATTRSRNPPSPPPSPCSTTWAAPSLLVALDPGAHRASVRRASPAPARPRLRASARWTLRHPTAPASGRLAGRDGDDLNDERGCAGWAARTWARSPRLAPGRKRHAEFYGVPVGPGRERRCASQTTARRLISASCREFPKVCVGEGCLGRDIRSNPNQALAKVLAAIGPRDRTRCRSIPSRMSSR